MKVNKPEVLPYFAELPYYLWGSINYNSDGNCKFPKDRDWTFIEANGRGEHADQYYSIRVQGFDMLEIQGSCADRVAEFFTNPEPKGAIRAQLVRELFERPELEIFNHNSFFGSWKWIGAFASDMTEAGRFLMLDALRGSTQGLAIAVEWSSQAFSMEQRIRLCAHVAAMCRAHSVVPTSLERPDDEAWPKDVNAWFQDFIKAKGIVDPLLK